MLVSDQGSASYRKRLHEIPKIIGQHMRVETHGIGGEGDRIPAQAPSYASFGYRARSRRKPRRRITPFVPYCYDERQHCSPGFDLPVGCLMRTPNGEYPEYHSSADNLSLLRTESLAHSLAVLRRVVDNVELSTSSNETQSTAAAIQRANRS